MSALELSLDDIISKQRTSKTKAKNSSKHLDFLDIELAKLIQKGKGERDRTIRGDDFQRKVRAEVPEPSTDVFKPLDDVIRDRGIRKPKERGLLSTKAENLRRADERVERISIGDIKPKIILPSEVDPRLHSLDDIIEVSGIQTQDERNLKRKCEDDPIAFKRRNRSNGGGGGEPYGAVNPYRAVQFMSQMGLIIKIVIGKRVIDESKAEEYDKSHKWRCIVSCGDIKGMCDSETKTLAREIACREFLKMLKQEFPDGQLPKYDIPEESFTDPRIFSIIEKEGVDVHHKLRIKDPSDKKCVYVCTYFVDGGKFEAESTSSDFARLKAAMKAYEMMKGEPFPKTKYHTEPDCDLSVEYDFNESEVHQTAEQNGKMEELMNES